MIIANCILIGVQSDFQVKHPGEKEAPLFVILDYTFSAFFLMELLLRMMVLRKDFVCSCEWRWNLFDTFVVITGVIESVIDIVGQERVGSDLTYLRIMRIYKLIRVFRIVRVFRVFRELRVMLLCIIATMRTLLWTLVSLFTLTFMFGVYIVMSVAEHQAEQWDDDLASHFGSLSSTLLVFFQATAGGIDWHILTDSLARVSVFAVIVFLLYICVVLYAIQNILTGVCVNQATRAADEDIESVIQEELMKHNGVANILKRLFHEGDFDGTGLLTWSRLSAHLRDPKVQAYFKSLHLEECDLRMFFELLQAAEDQETSGIDIDQFVLTCLRLKGPAKSADLLALRHELEVLAKKTSRLTSLIMKEFRASSSPAMQAACPLSVASTPFSMGHALAMESV